MKLPGEPATLTYDTPAVVFEGDYVRTTTGRLYLVTGAHVVRQRGGPRYSYDAGVLVQVPRWRLETVVMEPDHEVEDDATVHPLAWYRR